jgi:hypothetical protein
MAMPATRVRTGAHRRSNESRVNGIDVRRDVRTTRSSGVRADQDGPAAPPEGRLSPTVGATGRASQDVMGLKFTVG